MSMKKYYRQKRIIKYSLEEWRKTVRNYNDVDENGL